MHNALIGKGVSCPAGVGAGYGGADRVGNENDSQPPPTESSVRFRTVPHLVAAPKMGGGPGEGPKKKSGPRCKAFPQPFPGRATTQASSGSALAVIRTLLSARYPRTLLAIAASAGLARSTAYRALARIEAESGLPLRTERTKQQDRVGAMHWVTLHGIDWEKLRGMG